jgi:HAD superfamily hydrolase (TIGR01509 family)
VDEAHPIDALLFDFDGTIWDSEGAVLRAYRDLYERHGFELPIERWVAGVGTLDGFDPADELETLLGRAIESDAVDPWASLEHVGLRPGVAGYIDDARRRGLSLGIVSSNSAEWVGPHLARLGIADVWDVVLTADGDVAIAKPNPHLYRGALERLGTDPSKAIAIEDSTHGVAAAKAAGIFCVAVPNEVTRTLDLSAADVLVDSLEDLPLDRLLDMATRREP